MGLKVTGLTFSRTGRTLTAQWDQEKSSYSDKIASYQVIWFYNVGKSWYDGPRDDDLKPNPGGPNHSEYDVPEGSTGAVIWVTPVSKTYKGKNDQDYYYFTGERVIAQYKGFGTLIPSDIPDVTSINAEIKGNYITSTVTIDVSDTITKTIRFRILKENVQVAVIDCNVNPNSHVASLGYNGDPGSRYQIQAKGIGYNGTTPVYGEHYSESAPSSESYLVTTPTAIDKFTSCRASDKAEVYLSWNGNMSKYNYEIQYTEDSKYFDVSDNPSSVIVDASTAAGCKYYVTSGLTECNTFFFRIRAIDKNNSDQHSAWSAISSVNLGEKPGVPTTWSSASNYQIGDDPLTLYWTHNTIDGSKMTEATLTLDCDGHAEEITITPPSDVPIDEPEKTYSYVVDPSKYGDGSLIRWSVKTAGITGEYGNESVTREIHVYSRPSIHISMDSDTVTSFPFDIRMFKDSTLVGQNPISYHLSVISNVAYATIDGSGKDAMILPGDSVFSEFYDEATDSKTVTMTPMVIDLISGGNYTAYVTAAFDSGLTADANISFDVQFVDDSYIVDAEISTTNNDVIAYIRPYATYYDPQITSIPEAYLSVYRKNVDGSLTEIETGLDNAKNTTIIDPHPTLGNVRYRLIATDKATGKMFVYDTPPVEVKEKAIIIQWNEAWETIDPDITYDESGDPVSVNKSLMVQPYQGSMVKLPYNVDVSESVDLETEFVNYIGRSNPVSYYGTQVGEKSNWNTEIPKYDTETLYQLRRLSKWMGDVYVREPSGLGYWASIKLNFSQTHLKVTIPISIEITRVEGGK